MTPNDSPSTREKPMIDPVAGTHVENVLPEDPAALIRHRRRVRALWFIVFETVAIGVMAASIVAGISARFAAENLTPLFRILPISAAIVAVILPIFFFGDAKRRNRRRRSPREEGDSLK
jgi:hypothetical protein